MNGLEALEACRARRVPYRCIFMGKPALQHSSSLSLGLEKRRVCIPGFLLQSFMMEQQPEHGKPHTWHLILTLHAALPALLAPSLSSH